ncbi:L-proline trans-4-hydroxylase-like [Mytilus edulis]|uniref:L-proline trans-4-hydroxylase-like n=1 Tax=Mytilus edulis TaxID=6550 RepID=UPI0039F06949
MTNPEYKYTETFDITPEVRAAYNDHGYIIVRNMFDKEELTNVKRVLEDSDIIEKHGYGIPDGKGKNAKLVIWSHPGNDVTGIVARSRKVVDSCQKLLGGGEVYHYHAKFIRKDAFTGGSHLWHQDYGYWYKNGCLFPQINTIFIAVDKCEPSNGCLQILPGSQKCGRIDHFPVAGQTMADIERINEIKKRHPLKHVELDPGDALIFDANLIHTSGPNNSPHRRWALLYSYCLKSNNPVYKHHHPNYTPLEKVPNSAIKDCKNYTDFSGKDFMDPGVDKTVKADTLDK